MRTRHQERQQSAEPAKRTSRKRRASSASVVDISEGPSSSQTPSQSQSKRRKRHEGPHLFEEILEETASSSHPEAFLDPLSEDEGIKTRDSSTFANPTPTRQVRFSETAWANGNGSTSAHLTPHLNKNKKTFHRRITLSPSTLANSHFSSQRQKSRSSLPANFSFSQDSPGKVQELQFAPLSQILQARVKRRLRRSHLSEETNSIHESAKEEARARQELEQLRSEIAERDDRLRQLLYELEMQRQLSIDVTDENTQEKQKIREMETELVALKQEIEEKREQEAALPQIDGAGDLDIFDEDMMIINNSSLENDQSDEISYPDLESSQDVQEVQVAQTPLRSYPRATDQVVVNDAQTQVSLPDNNTQAEREAFEDAIRFWTREASDAKAALTILTIELQSLGFGDSNTSTDVVLNSIRDSFLHVRERLESALPGQVPADISNRDLIDLVTDHLESLAASVATHETAQTHATNLQQELLNEIDGLIDRLGDAEIRKNELERSFREADKQTQDDEIFINELENKLKEIQRDHDVVQALLDDRNSELTTLEQTNIELDSTVDKLGVALEGYRASEENLQALIERLEAEHHHALKDLEDVHKEAIDSIEAKLEAENAMRDIAEKDVAEKQLSITSLETRIEQDEANINSLRQRLSDLEEEKAAESAAKESLDAEVDEKTAFIEELEVKIENAEKNLDELRGELDRLLDLNEAEKRQRVAAEEELDVRELKIEDLNTKLREQGIQANELRQKLFEVQTREKESIEKLESDAQDREEQFQQDMSAEIARREEAESMAASRNVTIAEVEDALRRAEESMTETLRDRDEKITELGALADRLETALEKTNIELDSTITELETLQATSESRIAQLSDEIANLQSQVHEQSATISNLQLDAATTAETHSTAITERDTAIANLNHEIFEANNRIDTLESEKSSLESRVSAEAESMLELQASKDDEIAALKSTITAKQADIENLKHKAEEVDKAWEKLLTERDNEIEELRVSGDDSSNTIMRLTKLNMSLKEKLRRFVRDSTATANSMREDVESVLNATAQKNSALHEEGMRVLEEVEAMDQVSELTQASSSGAPQNKFLQKFKRSNKSRRQYDSGIGVEDEDESLLME